MSKHSETDIKSTYDHSEQVPELVSSTDQAVSKAEALRLAQLTDPGPDRLSYSTLMFTLVALCACLCSGDTGMDGTIMGAINSMTQYQSYFGLKAASPKTGIIFGMYTIGQLVAFFPASYLPDKFGRRISMIIGNVVLICGAVVSANATNQGAFIGGRFLTGLGCQTASTTAKSYMAEITSPSTRGRWMGLLNSFYFVGQILASGIAVPLGQQQSDWAWKTPLYIQACPATLCILTIWMCPESPRWLYVKGRKDQAARILARLHSKNNDMESPLVKIQLQEIEENISLSGADSRFWDFRALFASAAARYRFGMCLIVSFWGQLAGNGLITYFLTILLQQAGITSPDRQRVLNFANSLTSFAGALFGTSLTDKVGRRKLMLWAASSCMCGMAITGGLLSSAGEQSTVRANAGVTFIFLFQVCYSIGWAPLQGLYPAECLSYENRAKGLALQGLAAQSVSLINTFAMPVALAELSWKVYLIFAAWNFVGIFVIWYWTVETKQLTLEELDEVFAQENPKQYAFKIARQARERVKLEKAMLITKA